MAVITQFVRTVDAGTGMDSENLPTNGLMVVGRPALNHAKNILFQSRIDSDPFRHNLQRGQMGYSQTCGSHYFHQRIRGPVEGGILIACLWRAKAEIEAR